MSFLESVQRVTRDGVIGLLELSAPSFPDTLRICDDNQNFIFQGVEYIGFPFGFTLPSDQSSSASQIKLVIGNTGRGITEDLEMLRPNEIVRAVIKLIDRKNPTVVAKEWRVPLSNVSVNTATATATCGNFQMMKQQASRLRYDQSFSPGLF